MFHVLCELVLSVFYGRHAMIFYYHLPYITLISNKFSPTCAFSICIYCLREILFNLGCISIFVYFPTDLKTIFINSRNKICGYMSGFSFSKTIISFYSGSFSL